VRPQELREWQIAHPYATHVVRCTSAVKPGSKRFFWKVISHSHFFDPFHQEFSAVELHETIKVKCGIE
jgi:hypothetical protein